MNAVRSCVLGCTDANKIAFRAAPGWLVCQPCSNRLRQVLYDLERTYLELSDPDELIPGGSPDSNGGRRAPGPRSPAVDSLLVHMDPRSSTPPGASPAALASIAGFARAIREDRSLDLPRDQILATVPRGRISMRRECRTILDHWDWLMGQDWVDGFASEIREVLTALRMVRREFPRVVRIGACPVPRVAVPLAGGGTLTLDCGASLRVRVGDSEVRCRNCGTVWGRGQWHELGDPWTDYAALATELSVPVGTLWRWASEDQWRTETPGRRRLVLRADALDSYERRRGPLNFDQTG